jgi:hypothetical protein
VITNSGGDVEMHQRGDEESEEDEEEDEEEEEPIDEETKIRA